MKKITLTLSLACATLFANDAVMQQAKESMQQLGKSLKTELKAKFKEDPSGIKAIEYCSKQAQDITKEVNAKLDEDVTVRRTALKYRNQANEPSIQDIEVMRLMRYKIEKGGADPKKVMQTVETEDKYYVYKALAVGKPCLKCHGDTAKIDDKILSRIDKRFPHDKARNFAKGDFRGAIVAEIEK